MFLPWSEGQAGAPGALVRFVQSDRGLVTSEWVLIVAVLMVTGVFFAAQIYMPGIDSLSSGTGEAMENAAEDLDFGF
jgi:hypothetical protein